MQKKEREIMKIEKLTESEELVMKAIWDCEKEPVLSDVVERVNGHYGKDWKPQTVSTFLAKLVRKNYLKLCRNGKIYTYKILVPEKNYKQKLYKHHISFWNHNDTGTFVTEMFDNGDLSKEDIERLRAKIDEL
ncbi:MAG: BlaI/MecI/CopY family transcriptional regulator [Lachnospiraceae bacterium]|nr:BlaI/MecI/CopY family transcriptional regulator [Lachnospiraceae bacterium]